MQSNNWKEQLKDCVEKGWMEDGYVDYERFIETEIIEKLIGEMETHYKGYGSKDFGKKLSAKWLGKERDHIAGIDFGPSLTALDELAGRSNNV
jgi:hypothetical protein